MQLQMHDFVDRPKPGVYTYSMCVTVKKKELNNGFTVNDIQSVRIIVYLTHILSVFLHHANGKKCQKAKVRPKRSRHLVEKMDDDAPELLKYSTSGLLLFLI